VVTRLGVGTAAIALALAAQPDAATPPEIRTSVTLGSPPALDVKATYSDPVELFPLLNGTLVFPLLLEVRNVSMRPQTLDITALQLELGDSRGTPAMLRPMNARDAQKRLADDVKLNPVLKGILGQAGGSPWTSNTFDRDLRDGELKPGKSRSGYVFFLKPAAFQFNGVMLLGTRAHPPELLPTGKLTVTRSGGTGVIGKVCGMLASLPGAKTVCDALTGAPFGRSYALLFGISNYQAANLPQLLGVGDVKRMSDYLTLQSFDQVVVFKDNEVTPSALRDVQSHFGGKILPDDRLLVYYAGHGQLSTNGGADLVLANGSRVPMTQFMSWLRTVKVKHLLVLLDACYSGNIVGGTRGAIPQDADAATSDKLMRIASRGSRFVITAGASDERALENPQWWQGGLFTYAVLSALQPASTKPNLVTTYQMFSKVRDVMFDQERIHGVTLQTPLIQDLGYSSEGKSPAPASEGEFVFVSGK
jgi:hypothetical protein